MTIEKITYIRELQQLYRDRYGEELQIDFPLMKGVIGKLVYTYVAVDQMERRIAAICKKHGAELEQIRTSHLNAKGVRHLAAKRALEEISVVAINGKWSLSVLAKMVNKDRSCFYYYYKRIKRSTHVK